MHRSDEDPFLSRLLVLREPICRGFRKTSSLVFGAFSIVVLCLLPRRGWMMHNLCLQNVGSITQVPAHAISTVVVTVPYPRWSFLSMAYLIGRFNSK